MCNYPKGYSIWDPEGGRNGKFRGPPPTYFYFLADPPPHFFFHSAPLRISNGIALMNMMNIHGSECGMALAIFWADESPDFHPLVSINSLKPTLLSISSLSLPSRQLTVHWQPTMLKLHRDSSFTPPGSQNCPVGKYLNVIPTWQTMWNLRDLRKFWILGNSRNSREFREFRLVGRKLTDNSDSGHIS